MCGRYQVTLPTSSIAAYFDAELGQKALNLGMRWNAAPSQVLPILATRTEGRGRLVEAMSWGFTAHSLLINARIETLLEKRSFANAARDGRIAVPMTAFYEWQDKVPHAIRIKMDQETGEIPLFAAAAIARGNQFVVVTTAPNDLVAPIHQRMPVLLEGDLLEEWLTTPANDTETLIERVREPFAADRMEAWPISRAINSAALDEPGMDAKVEIDEPPSLF